VMLICRNTVTGFVPLDHPVVPIANGKVALGSWYTAGRLDLMVTGGYTKLYMNTMFGVNTPPSVPGGLLASVSGDSTVLFRWNRASDTESPSVTLTYNLRVGTTPGGSEVLSAMANSSGARYLSGPGNAGTDTTHLLRGLVRGRRYYWAVQAVDNGYVASAFSSERSFYFGLTVHERHREQLALPITDFQLTTDTIQVAVGIGGAPAAQGAPAASTWRVRNLAVMIDSVSHPSVGDLILTLSHLGVTDTLIHRAGGGGADLRGTVLEDAAAVPIESGTPPFTGTFRPSRPLFCFTGMETDGEWRLGVSDLAAGGTGVLQGWGLIIAYDHVVGAEEEEGLPETFVLLPNFPNPFNPTTQIRFGLPHAEEVSVEVYTLLGQRVMEMRPGRLQPGFHSVVFDAKAFASGVYLYRVRAGEQGGIGKMVLVR
jgi:hypothetical protein